MWSNCRIATVPPSLNTASETQDEPMKLSMSREPTPSPVAPHQHHTIAGCSGVPKAGQGEQSALGTGNKEVCRQFKSNNKTN